jgi:hypothetical protein
MKFYYRILVVVCIALFMAQCDAVEPDEILNDPNNPSPANIDANFLLNNIQFEGRSVYAGASGLGAEMSRMGYMFGDTYNNAYSSQSFNGVYQNAYADLFIDVQNLLPIARERQLYFHAGIAKTLKAYAMLTLVDVYGDVPLSEALDPSNFNPGLDEGAAVYDSALVLLDDAIADFQNEDRRALPVTDLYYGTLPESDRQEAWVRLANTLKLKAYLNMGDAANFSAIADPSLVISEARWDFTFDWGTTTTNPDSRHPAFTNNYVDVANDYTAVNYLNMMLNDKTIADPRRRYYFYRQTTSDPTDVNLNTCIAANKPGHFTQEDPFCLLGDGWWGRDHLIDDGIPPDGDLRTTWGVYPIGGRFDANQGEPTEPEQGYQGAGFDPIMMSSYTWFMIAEGELNLNNNPAGAKTALDIALDESFNTIADFGFDQADGTGFEIAADSGASGAYTDIVDDRWATRDQLRVISKEFYLALWPNGIEAYNMMRRTGYPNRIDNLQPARSPNPGLWYRSFSYPAVLTERNSNVTQKDNNHVRVFWDTRGNDDEFDF